MTMPDTAAERCETCGAISVDDCRYRYEDVGCDHPSVFREVSEALGGWLNGEQPKGRDK